MAITKWVPSFFGVSLISLLVNSEYEFSFTLNTKLPLMLTLLWDVHFYAQYNLLFFSPILHNIQLKCTLNRCTWQNE